MVRKIDTILTTPAYPFSEAAHYLAVPTSTLRSWCLGQSYSYRGASRRFSRIIRLDGRPFEGLSFLNLVETHVLSAIRRVHGISLPRVRHALDYVARELNVERPLFDVQFQTNGIDLFVDELNVSQGGQLGFALMLHLQRVVRDPKGVPIKLYPFIRKERSANAPAPIEIDPRIAFGRPVLRARAVPTAVLADRFKAGDTVGDLADDYEISPEEIEEAIRCELDRRAEAA